jgi:hypothetical protein
VRSWDAVARDLLTGSRDVLATAVEWRVHSVFARACNLVSDDGMLLGIVQGPAWNGPATLVLAPGALPAPLTGLLRPGAPARRDGNRLWIADRVGLELSAARLWAPTPIVRTLDAAQIAARLDRAAEIVAAEAPRDGLARLLVERPLTRRLPLARARVRDVDAVDIRAAQRPGGEGPQLLRRASIELDRIEATIRAHAWSGVLEPARQLSGLGPGLTPSGDDLLAGLALGFRAARGALPDALAAAILTAVDGRTTDLAIVRVQHAVAGRADEAVHRVLALLVGGPVTGGSDVENAVRAVLDYGHSSGADTLVGLIVGLRLGLNV